MKQLIAFLAIAILSGCGTVGVRQADQLKPGASIVPVSLMGDALAIRYVGTTVFENRSRDVTVTDWHVDDYAESTMSRLLGAGNRFKVTAPATKNAKARIGKLGTDFWTGKTVLHDGAKGISQLAMEAGADYVLVVVPAQTEDPFFGTNQNISGYGIYQRSVFGSRRAIDFLTMRMALLDGKSGTEVVRAYGRPSSRRTEAVWMDSESLELSEDNARETRVSIQTLMEGFFRKALADLTLVP